MKNILGPYSVSHIIFNRRKGSKRRIGPDSIRPNQKQSRHSPNKAHNLTLALYLSLVCLSLSQAVKVFLGFQAEHISATSKQLEFMCVEMKISKLLNPTLSHYNPFQIHPNPPPPMFKPLPENCVFSSWGIFSLLIFSCTDKILIQNRFHMSTSKDVKVGKKNMN